MTVLDTNFPNTIHFPVRLTFATAALVAVITLWATGMLGLEGTENVAAVAPQPCVEDTQECANQWLFENLSNIEYTVGAMPAEGVAGVNAAD